MKRLILLSVLSILVSGCAFMSPYYAQFQQLDRAYKSGQITYGQYMNAYNDLKAQERQWLHDASVEMGNRMQQAQAQAQAEERRQLENAALRSQIMNSRMQAIRSMSPVNTNCYQIGNQISCQSH